MSNQVIGEKNPTIDTNLYEALIVMNNIVKCHQDRNINDPRTSNENGYVKNPNFSSLISLYRRPTQNLTLPFLCSSSSKTRSRHF